MNSAYLGFFVLLLLSQCSGKSYRNHALIRAAPYEGADLIIFKTFKKFYNVTWWKAPTILKKNVEFSIGPKNLARLYKDMENMKIRFILLIKDLQSAFDKQKAATYVRRNMASFNWKNYYRLDDIYNWLRDVSARNPTEVQLHRVGTTHENRTILSARLTLRGSKDRSKVIIEGGIHAREWISPAFVTYMLYTLLNARNNDNPELYRIAHTYTWIFVPVLNADGYEYSHTVDRLWRKNRRPGVGGVDLNRNYDSAFGTHSVSATTTSDVYCGEKPFSEPESNYMAMLTKEHSSRLEYYIAMHSYGQYIILPYGHLKTHKDNFEEVITLAGKTARRIQAKHGFTFNTGNSFETVGALTSGTSMDWVKMSTRARYVVTIELPDKGLYGFALPPDRILPACQATMDGLMEFLTPQSNKFMRKKDSEDSEARNDIASNEAVYVCNSVIIMSCVINFLRYSFVFTFSI